MLSFSHPYLVGGVPTPLKNMKVSWDDYPIYYGKSENSMVPVTTNQLSTIGDGSLLSCVFQLVMTGVNQP